MVLHHKCSRYPKLIGPVGQFAFGLYTKKSLDGLESVLKPGTLTPRSSLFLVDYFPGHRAFVDVLLVYKRTMWYLPGGCMG